MICVQKRLYKVVKQRNISQSLIDHQGGNT